MDDRTPNSEFTRSNESCEAVSLIAPDRTMATAKSSVHLKRLAVSWGARGNPGVAAIVLRLPDCPVSSLVESELCVVQNGLGDRLELPCCF